MRRKLLKLSKKNCQCYASALERAELRRRLPKLRRNYCRFRIHDIPQRYISDALFIDPGLTLIDAVTVQSARRMCNALFRNLEDPYFAACPPKDSRVVPRTQMPLPRKCRERKARSSI